MNINLFNRISQKEKSFLTRQLATMLSSGLPIIDGLEILENQSRKETLKKSFADIVKKIKDGSPFSAAISRHPKIFSKVFVAVVKSGESSGKLDLVLDQLADQMEKDTGFSSKVKSALAYPIFILSAMIFVVVLMIVKVIPQLQDIFAEAEADLPWTTKFLLAISGFTVQYWWTILIFIFVLIIGLKIWFSTEAGNLQWDKIKLKFPGGIVQNIYMARFTRTMGMLIGAGISIIESLNIVVDVIGNKVFSESIEKIVSQVKRGVPISRPLSSDSNFPIIVSQMMAVGEQTGKMDEILNKLADFYEEEANSKIAGISSLIEPVLLVVLGLGVAFIIFSILMPIYNIAQIG